MKIITAVMLTLSFLVFSALFGASVLAARSIIIDSYSQTLTNDEEGEVKMLLNGFTDGESIFIKGAFSFPDSTNYFGFTKKGDTWVKNSITAADQLSIIIGEWDGNLAIKPDLSDTGFRGSGNYNFKVGFYYYTGGGNLSSVNWSDAKSVNITFVPSLTPTATPQPTATSVPTVKPTLTAKPAVTNLVTPIITAPAKAGSLTKDNISAIQNSPKLISGSKPKVTDASIAQSLIFRESSESGDSKTLPITNTRDQTRKIVYFFILSGILCFAVAVYLSFNKTKKEA